jgi:replication-associated recombination protein RarA
MTTQTIEKKIATLADSVLQQLEKSAKGDVSLAIAALAIAMCALARADAVPFEDLRNCLGLAHREINPRLDS